MYLHFHTSMEVHVQRYMHVYVCIYVSICVYIYIYMYVDLDICVHATVYSGFTHSRSLPWYHISLREALN